MNYSTRKCLLSFTIVRQIRYRLKRIKFAKSDQFSLYHFLGILIRNLDEDEIIDRANGVTFNFILAIFPAIIFLFTLIPYISNYFPQISTTTIMNFLKTGIPATLYAAVSATIFDIVSIHRGGLLTVGFIFAVYLSTNGMLALMRALNACYHTVDNRNWVHTRLTATWLTLMLSVVLLLTVALLIVGQVGLNFVTENIEKWSDLNLHKYAIYSLFGLRFFILFIVFFVAISFVYYFGPAVHDKWKFFSIGSLIASLAVLAVSYGFSFYITNFSSYHKVYGSIGAFIALMVWMQLVSLTLLFGYEINASLHYARRLYNRKMHRAKIMKSLQ